MEDGGTADDFRYDAFISYRHAEMDKAIAERLHRALETYRVPGPLVRRGLPRQIKRVFRDREELPTSSNLSEDIQRALRESRCLIVICSPRTPESRWVTREIEIFMDLGRGDRILPVLIEGEPADSFPAPIRPQGAQAGDQVALRPSSGVLEPAADVRANKLRRSLRLLAREKLRLIARILGCGYSELEARDHERSIRQKGALALAVFLLVSAVGFFNYSQFVRAEEQRKTTETERDRAMAAISLLTYETPERLGNMPGALSILTTVFEEDVELLDRILSLSPDSPEAGREVGSNLLLACDGWLRLGDTRRAQQACEEALAISLELAQDKADAVAQWDLSVSYSWMGDVKMAQGDLTGALEVYEKSLAIDLELAEQTPHSQAHRNVSISYSRIGDVRMAQGNLTGALEAYEKSLAIALELARDETSVEAQRDLSVIYSRIGDVRMAQGNLTGALEAYEKSLTIDLELAQDKSNAQMQRSLSISYERMGNVRLMQDDLTGAREAFEKALAIALELAQDKSNAQAQRDLAVSYSRMGDVMTVQGDLTGALDAREKSLAIFLELAQDKSDAQAQRDLGISYSTMGDARMAEGDLTAAAAAYESALAIAIELGQDSSNAQAQRDLAFSYQAVGRVRMAQDDLEGAREARESALAIYLELAQDKSDAQAQRNLAIAYGGLSWLELLDRRPSEAVSAAVKGLEADPTQVWIKTNLAHGYLLDDQVEKATAIYVENKDVILDGTRSFADAVREDFKLLREKGITHAAMDRIEQLLR
jgi:tetratricopeptide (TPR) repeat protein